MDSARELVLAEAPPATWRQVPSYSHFRCVEDAKTEQPLRALHMHASFVFVMSSTDALWSSQSNVKKDPDGYKDEFMLQVSSRALRPTPDPDGCLTFSQDGCRVHRTCAGHVVAGGTGDPGGGGRGLLRWFAQAPPSAWLYWSLHKFGSRPLPPTLLPAVSPLPGAAGHLEAEAQQGEQGIRGPGHVPSPGGAGLWVGAGTEELWIGAGKEELWIGPGTEELWLGVGTEELWIGAGTEELWIGAGTEVKAQVAGGWRPCPL